MSAKLKVQHLTFFLLKSSVKKFEDAVKSAEAGSPTPLTNQSFTGALYLPAPAVNSPGWLPFVQSGFPGQNALGNRVSSALVLIKVEKRIFALTFGHARHLLKPDSFERDFGLRVVVNRVSKENIRGITLQAFKETSVKRQEEAAKGTALRTFGVDLQQDLLRGVTGVPEDASFASRIGGADSLAIDVPMEFGGLADKCKELLAAYSGTEYVNRGFGWIDNLKIVRSRAVVEQLDELLVAALKAKDQTIQMLCPDTFSREAIRGFLHHGEKSEADKHAELEFEEWQAAFGRELKKLTVEKLRERKIATYDGDGAKLSDIPDRDCFVFETDYNGAKFILSNGEWFEVATNFDAEITDYVNQISRQSVTLPHFDKTWKYEDRYVAEAAKSPDLMSMHKKTCMIGGTPIEPCDLLHRSGALVHVKRWSQSATFSHLLAQGAISAESLLRYAEFRDHVAKSAIRHQDEIKRLFPTDAFVTSNLSVVLALVRETSKPLPFFSRLNLMREGQRIERLGYSVNYHRIEVI